MKKIATFLWVLAVIVGGQAQDSTPLSEASFEVHRKEIVGQSFDSKRMVKAKKLSDEQFLYVYQIRAIMEGFALEGSRLDYAKYAYTTVLDAENYSSLLSMFRLGTSKDELKQYLAQRKAPVIPKKELPSTTKTNEVVDKEVDSEPELTEDVGPNPMTDQAFATAKRQVEEQSFESSKLRKAKQLSDANYLLVSQVKEIAEVLNFESSRLEYVQYAYAKTYDQANYAIVKECLKHSKSKEELSSFLKKQSVTDYSIIKKEKLVKKEQDSQNEKKEPNLVAIAEGDFINAKNEISAQTSDTKKLTQAKELVNRAYLTSEQVTLIIELFLFEDNRLSYAKYAYAKTVDPENYQQVKDILEKESHKILEDYIKGLKKATSETTEATGPSELSTEDFEALKKRIKGAALESHKLAKAKQIVDRSKVSAMQVKQINELFELEESRLEFAQYAYSKTMDKEAYEQVRATLTESTNKYKLDRFIKEQK